MFAYCGNNPVNYIDESGLLFFAALGAAIGGASAFVDALWEGKSITEAKKSACAGVVSGFISGLGVDIAVATVASGYVGIGLFCAGTMGAIGSVVGTGMANDWKVDPFDYVASAIVGGTMNLLSLGTADEIAKGTFKTMVGSLLRNGISNLGENTVMGTVVAFGTLLITRALTDNSERTKKLTEK